ncbi:MAG: hydroxyacylglutathione hydrolase family protein [Candidatus Paceibacterota bacterium]
MGILVVQCPVTGFDKNFAYLIYHENTHDGYIVDPSGNTGVIHEAVRAHDVEVVGIILTHTHADHFDGLDEVLTHYPVPVFVHTLGREKIPTHMVLPLHDGEVLKLRNRAINIIHTPGHIADAICLYISATAAADDIPKVITGDTLFVGGCGRTNATGVKDLYESLAELKALPPETVVYPGHDYGETPTSTIGEEVENNKYYTVKNITEFQQLRLG